MSESSPQIPAESSSDQISADQSSAIEKPGMFTAISIMTLANGILNILYGMMLTCGLTLVSLGIGLLCAPLAILPAVLGIFEIIYAAKLMANPSKPVQPSIALGILEICCVLWGNMLSPVVGVLNLVFYNDDSVKAYFAQINSQTTVE